jgi:hypothetical protein
LKLKLGIRWSGVPRCATELNFFPNNMTYQLLEELSAGMHQNQV